jgi:hypothetical protein
MTILRDNKAVDTLVRTAKTLGERLNQTSYRGKKRLAGRDVEFFKTIHGDRL